MLPSLYFEQKKTYFFNNDTWRRKLDQNSTVEIYSYLPFLFILMESDLLWSNFNPTWRNVYIISVACTLIYFNIIKLAPFDLLWSSLSIFSILFDTLCSPCHILDHSETFRLTRFTHQIVDKVHFLRGKIF